MELAPDAAAAAAPADMAGLAQTLSRTEPRFSFFRYAHAHAGEETAPVLFLYTGSTSAEFRNPRHRMVYPLMKGGVVAAAEAEGLRADRRFEFDDPAEISDAAVLANLHPSAETKAAPFRRPKRPGR